MGKGNGTTRNVTPSNMYGDSNNNPTLSLDQIIQQETSSFLAPQTDGRRSYDRVAFRNVGNIVTADAFAKNRKSSAIKEGVLDGIGRMYDSYDIPRLTQVAFYGENRFSNEAAATSPDGKYMRFNTSINSRNEAKEFAYHEMTHLMTGPKFERLSNSASLRIQSIYYDAMKNISPAKGRGAAYFNYWRTNMYEFVSVSFQKALTGQSMNEYEKRAFLLVHNSFKKK